MKRIPSSCLALFLVAGGCAGSIDPDAFGSCEAIVQNMFNRDCNSAGCHNSIDAAARLDLEADGLFSRLVDVSARGDLCTGLLVDPTNPDESLMYTKTTASPPCGDRMPWIGIPANLAEQDCMLEWITALVAAGP